MKFSRPPKSQQLSPFVKAIWCYSTTEIDPRFEKILPTTHGQLLINLQGKKLRHLNEVHTVLREIGSVGLQGVLTQPVLIDKEQKHNICGVQFAAGGLSAFTERHAIHFCDEIIDAQEIWGASVCSLRASLSAENDPMRRCDQIEALLLQHIIHRPGEDEVVQEWVEALGSGARVTKIQERTGISQRQLHDLFARRIGVRPKLFARIGRFSAALSGLPDESSLSSLAHEGEYSDQAHMTREFQRFAKFPPRSLSTVAGEPHHATVETDEKFKTKKNGLE